MSRLASIPPRLRGQLPAGAWPWIAAALLALAAIAAALLAHGWSGEARRQAEDNRRQAAAARAQRAALAARATAEAPPPPPALPPASERQSLLADLLELALRHGVTVARAEQRLERADDAAAGRGAAAATDRLRIAMPASAGYAELRGFVEEALRQQPALSLDGLRLQRAAPQAAQVEAELQWTLWLRR